MGQFFTKDWPKHLIITSLTHAVRDLLSSNLSGEHGTHIRARIKACLSLAECGARLCWQVALQRGVCGKVCNFSPAPALPSSYSLCPHVLGRLVWAWVVVSSECKGRGADMNRQLPFVKDSDHHLYFVTCWRAVNPSGQWVFEGGVCCLNKFYMNTGWDEAQSRHLYVADNLIFHFHSHSE